MLIQFTMVSEGFHTSDEPQRSMVYSLPVLLEVKVLSVQRIWNPKRFYTEPFLRVAYKEPYL